VFGLRYHVASLAGVFLALAVGILLGVAISGKVSDAEESLQEERRQQLEEDLENARASAEAAGRSGEAAEEVVERTYPALMEGRLEDRGVAVAFLGPVDGTIRAEVERALSDAGSGSPVRVVALEVPVDALELQNRLEGDEVLASYAGDGGDFSTLGEELGRELAEGGETPLWSALQSDLVEERSGAASPEVEGAVVVASWQPEAAEGDGDAEAESRATSTLMDGIVQGLESSGLPVVGVATTEQPSELSDVYRTTGVSSVDDVDVPAGRLALALLLAGAEPGHYGMKDTAADGVVPPLDSLPDAGD
jgi:riboflavin biosynthesis pyrimidine reductase